MNKKIPALLGIAILIIFSATIGLFLWRYGRIKPEKSIPVVVSKNELPPPANESNSQTIAVSEDWKLVSYDNLWNNPQVISKPPYNFPNVKFYYPGNWTFRCCGDMDHASEHFINPPNRNSSSPYIRITDFVLTGCPNSQSSCALDKTIKLSANEKYRQLISAISSENILPKIRIEKLEVDAFVFKKTEKSGQISKAFLINLGNDVMEVDFINYELLGDSFITKFLNNVSPDSK